MKRQKAIGAGAPRHHCHVVPRLANAIGTLTDQEPPYERAMGSYSLRALLYRIQRAEAPTA
jgi:hypothetical protein